MFTYNNEILYSYDICGSCEAHALQLGISLNISDDIYKLPTLFELDRKYKQSNLDFERCPEHIVLLE